MFCRFFIYLHHVSSNVRLESLYLTTSTILQNRHFILIRQTEAEDKKPYRPSLPQHLIQVDLQTLMRTTCTADDTTAPTPPTTGNPTTTTTTTTTTIKNATTKLRRRNTPATTTKTKKQKMNNAENHAAIEITRKIAKEDSRYESMERGEKRNFEKPDKPVDNISGEKHVADSLSQLPPEDLKNVGILALLCTFSQVVKTDERSAAGN